jgi:hypothetical protein
MHGPRGQRTAPVLGWLWADGPSLVGLPLSASRDRRDRGPSPVSCRDTKRRVSRQPAAIAHSLSFLLILPPAPKLSSFAPLLCQLSTQTKRVQSTYILTTAWERTSDHVSPPTHHNTLPKMASKTSAVADEPIEVLFALHPKFNLLDFAGPLEVLTSSQHDAQDPSEFCHSSVFVTNPAPPPLSAVAGPDP